jgi:hypothetical protein
VITVERSSQLGPYQAMTAFFSAPLRRILIIRPGSPRLPANACRQFTTSPSGKSWDTHGHALTGLLKVRVLIWELTSG